MYGTALNTTKSSGNNNRQPPPAPTNANAAAAAAAAVETERPALPEDSDQRSMAGGNDHAEVVLPPSGLDKVRDVDGVQLMARRLSDSSHSIIRGRGGETDTDDDDVKAQSTGAERLRSTSESPRKMLVHEVDPMHYRKLVKGLIPIRSSLMRANIGNSTTDVQHRKSVHFSDQDGYYLSHVRSFDKPEEAPEVPLYATAYLNLNDVDDTSQPAPAAAADPSQVKTLRTCFTQPGVMPDFMDKVQQKKVKLEFCVAHDTDMSLSGTVRVANVSFHKSVYLRYTLDKWKTNEPDVTGYYIYTSDQDTDRFSFILRLPDSFDVGNEMEFAVRFDAGSTGTFWDNNSGENYRVKCLTRASFALPSGCNTDLPSLPWQQFI